MKKIIKLSILVILLSLLTMAIIIPRNLNARFPLMLPGTITVDQFGYGCYCPSFPLDCLCGL